MWSVTMLGSTELLIILGVVVLLFGAKKIPDLAKGLGQGIKEFKEASKEVKAPIEEVKKEVSENDDKKSS